MPFKFAKLERQRESSEKINRTATEADEVLFLLLRDRCVLKRDVHGYRWTPVSGPQSPT